MLKVVHDENETNDESAVATGRSLLDEIVRDGARAMLAAALQAEVAAYVEAFAGELDDAGRRLVVRNGHHEPREVMTAAGLVNYPREWWHFSYGDRYWACVTGSAQARYGAVEESIFDAE